MVVSWEVFLGIIWHGRILLAHLIHYLADDLQVSQGKTIARSQGSAMVSSPLRTDYFRGWKSEHLQSLSWKTVLV